MKKYIILLLVCHCIAGADVFDTTINQTNNYIEWVKIGSFTMQAGTANYMSINNYTPVYSSNPVYFNAIKVEKTGTTDPRFSVVFDASEFSWIDTAGQWSPLSVNKVGYTGKGFIGTDEGQAGNKTVTCRFPVHQDGIYEVYEWHPAWIDDNSANIRVGYNLAGPDYSLTVINGSGGGPYAEQEYVTVTASTAPGGTVFFKWTSSAGGVFFDSLSSSTVFTMPAHACSVTAVFTPIQTLTVVNGTGGGSFPQGQSLEIAANAPSPGRFFEEWTSSAGGVFKDPKFPVTQFTMPAHDVTVTANYCTSPVSVVESARKFPVTHNIDVVVVGGNIGGVAAAITAAKLGASVLIINPADCFSDEFSLNYHLYLDSAEIPRSGLERSFFGNRNPPALSREFYSPGGFKKKIEDSLTAAGVDFLYWSYAVEVLKDQTGNPCGVVFTGKSGTNAVLARIIVDATPMGGMAKKLGASFTQWPQGKIRVTRTVYGNQTDPLAEVIIPDTWGGYGLRRYSTDVSFSDGGMLDRCMAEQAIRKTFPLVSPQGVDATWMARKCHFIEPVRVLGQSYYEGAWKDGDSLDIGCFKPAGVERVYVLSSASSVSRANAAKLFRPLALMRAGTKIGSQISSELGSIAAPSAGNASVVHNAYGSEYNSQYAIPRSKASLRPYHQYPDSVTSADNHLPVLGEYDVVIAGGGTAGAPAAIAAVRAGAKVLVIDASGWLGGIGTNGIHSFWAGVRQGFGVEWGGPGWKSVEKAEHLYYEITHRGGDVWLNTIVCGVVKDGNCVTGVIIATPQGRAAVIGKRTIDATGDGDVCVWAGAEYNYVNNRDMAIQDAGLSGGNYMGSGSLTSRVFVDQEDAVGVTYYYRLLRNGSSFDYYPLLSTRETRKITGEYTVSVLDCMIQNTYTDAISMAASNFDPHGYYDGPHIVARMLEVSPNYIPYRAILPKGLDGILVTGRCHSVTHDAQAINRMQVDLANEGYAAGYIAAKSVADNVPLRSVNIADVQAHLGAIGNLSPSQMANIGVKPLPDDQQISEAASNASGWWWISILMRDTTRGLPALRSSMLSSPNKNKAFTLCLMGDTAGVQYLANWVNGQSLGTGTAYSWNAFQNGPDEMDAALYALGMPCDARAVSALCSKLYDCDSSATDFSRVLTICRSLIRIKSPAAAASVSAFLDKPGITGHVKEWAESDAIEERAYVRSVIELYAAAALLRSGDDNDKARAILADYLQNDWRGIMERYAGYMLSESDSGYTAVQKAGNETMSLSMTVSPNPFNPVACIHFRQIGLKTLPDIFIYDVRGRLVNKLAMEPVTHARGPNTAFKVLWDGRDLKGCAIASGIYVVQARSGDRIVNKKVALLK